MLKTEFRLSFASDVYLDQANHLRNRIAAILERQDFGSLTILFSSEGGSTDQSLALYNFITGLPVPVHMHAIGRLRKRLSPCFPGWTKTDCRELDPFFLPRIRLGFHWQANTSSASMKRSSVFAATSRWRERLSRLAQRQVPRCSMLWTGLPPPQF